MAMPWARALGGRKVRKRRAALARLEKGLNLVFTSVMKREIILGGTGGTPWESFNCAGHTDGLRRKVAPEKVAMFRTGSVRSGA
jgi:hypothetical protein